MHILAYVLPISCLDSSVLELIIEEQVEKLQATLRGIETLSVVARHTASKLTELIGNDEVRVHMCCAHLPKRLQVQLESYLKKTCTLTCLYATCTYHVDCIMCMSDIAL